MIKDEITQGIVVRALPDLTIGASYDISDTTWHSCYRIRDDKGVERLVRKTDLFTQNTFKKVPIDSPIDKVIEYVSNHIIINSKKPHTRILCRGDYGDRSTQNSFLIEFTVCVINYKGTCSTTDISIITSQACGNCGINAISGINRVVLELLRVTHSSWDLLSGYEDVIPHAVMKALWEWLTTQVFTRRLNLISTNTVYPGLIRLLNAGATDIGTSVVNMDYSDLIRVWTFIPREFITTEIPGEDDDISSYIEAIPSYKSWDEMKLWI